MDSRNKMHEPEESQYKEGSNNPSDLYQLGDIIREVLNRSLIQTDKRAVSSDPSDLYNLIWSYVIMFLGNYFITLLDNGMGIAERTSTAPYSSRSSGISPTIIYNQDENNPNALPPSSETDKSSVTDSNPAPETPSTDKSDSEILQDGNEHIPLKTQESVKKMLVARELGISPEIMETLDSVVIRIKIPEGMDESYLTTYIGDSHISIKWRPSYQEQVFKLPADIIREAAAGTVSDNMLEIKIPRKGSENTRRAFFNFT